MPGRRRRVELPAAPHASRLRLEGTVFGLNQDFPLVLSSMLRHGAANFGDVEVVSVNRDEHVRLNYRLAAARAQSLASALRRLGFGTETLAGSLGCRRRRSATPSILPATARCSSISTQSTWRRVCRRDWNQYINTS
jgi:hypothetical protein